MSPLPPLVAPGPPLDPADIERYSRHLLIPAVGDIGQRRLKAARVAVVGAGGLGSPALLFLAAAGVGMLTVIDDDVVNRSNLQRQVIHPDAAVGRPKVESAAAAVQALNPSVVVVTRETRLTADNAADLLRGHHVVLDGADNFETRYTVNDACERLDIPCVWASVYRAQGQISVFWRSAPHGVDLRDLFPEPPDPASVPTCGDAGVIGALTGQIGAMMAGEAIKLVCGTGRPLLGRLAFIDLLEGTSSIIPLGRADRARARVSEAHATVDPPPPPVIVSPLDLSAELSSPNPPLLLDVREPSEVAIASIAGSEHIPLAELLAAPPELGPDTDIVVFCKVQPRAEAAANALIARGHRRVRVLEGGIVAWSNQVDSRLVRY